MKSAPKQMYVCFGAFLCVNVSIWQVGLMRSYKQKGCCIKTATAFLYPHFISDMIHIRVSRLQ